ncbi:MAG TPA: FKBP-type peptidyl-prolyl cis-trans isomerase [Steroidobacteraceae bacterium]
MKSLVIRSLSLAAAVLVLGSVQAADSDTSAPAPKVAAKASAPKTAPVRTEQEQQLYALGQIMARNLETFQLTDAEFAQVKAGFAVGLRNRISDEDAQAVMPKLQQMQKTRFAKVVDVEKDKGKVYADQAAGQPGAKKTASGLIYTVVVDGTGASPKATDQVKVNYEGKLIDGKVFDSSIQRGQPVTLALNGVIPCWTEALQLMKVGGKSHIVCPADIAYGDRAPGIIKAGSTLVFDVELLDIVPPAAPGAPAAGPAPAPAPSPPPGK